MANIKYLVIFVLFYSCNKEVNYNFIDNQFKTRMLNHEFMVKNPSKYDYAFYSFNSTGIEENRLVGVNSIRITDENNKQMNEIDVFVNYRSQYNYREDSLLMNENKLKGFDRNIFWYSVNRDIKKNAVFARSGEKKIFKRGIALLRDQIKNASSFFLLKKDKKYFIQIEIDFDSINIKEFLTPDDLDSLKRNNIKIFHGKLRTKRIPLIVD